MNEAREDSISIVGLSFQLPQAADWAALWDVLRSGREVTGPAPLHRFRCDVTEVERLLATERPAAFRGAYLDDVERFDARHFDISPMEARRMDPQQRLALEESWRALEDAGFEPRALRGTATGVFVGSSNHDYVLSMSHDLTKADIFKILGNALGMVANRISHFLDLRGPSFTLDTACSSGLVALHTAMQSLRRKETDLALCGGVNLITSPHLSVAFSRARMLSDDGHCKAFSADADGYVRGEAVVFFVLMRTADALRQGRRSYGELLGSAVNQDGHTRVLTAPNLEAQVAVMHAALTAAGVEPSHLSALEAHGTGTPVGDAVEYEAIAQVLGGGSAPREQPCVVSTAKSYFGHAEPASGLVGLLKLLSALEHEELPRHRHFRALNPTVTAAPQLISLPLDPVAWKRTSIARLAGVSSFGFGGTNAHVVLREPPPASGARPALTRFGGERHWKKNERTASPSPAPEPLLPSGAAVLADVVAQVAQLLSRAPEQVATSRPLLDLGVDSLDLFTLLQKVEARYGVKLPLESALRPGATLASLAALVSASAAPRTGAFSMAPPSLEESTTPSPGERAAITAYTERSAGSKAHTERYRAVLADNRNSAGFRPHTKELTYPLVAERAQGARLWDVDGHERLDFSMGFGVHLFGHAPDFILTAVQEALRKGAPVGPQSPVAGEVAALLHELTGLERFSFTNSGTEAVMLACRLARAATGRRTVVIFEGAYHGTFDGLLGQPGEAGTATRPLTLGTTDGMVEDLLVLPWDDTRSLERIAALGDSVAAILVEPVQSRRPAIQPRAFLHALRGLATQHGAALVFDEVITGLRSGQGGAQAHFGVRADLATYGKVLGGGFPIGAVGGSAKFLDRVDGGVWRFGDGSAPRYDVVFFAGTFCKHPLAMAAARAVLQRLRAEGAEFLPRLNAQTAALCERLNAAFVQRALPLEAVQFASLFRLQSSRNLDLLFAHLNGAGFYLWEGRTLFLSTAHTEADVAAFEAELLVVAERVLQPERLRASAPQRRFLELPAGSRAGNVGFAVEVLGTLDRARFQQALLAVLDRHEIFRARFGESVTFDGPPRFLCSIEDVPRDRVPERLLALSGTHLDVHAGPLAFFELLQTGPEHFVLAVLTHGVLLDGYSLAVLIQEVALEYQSPQPGLAPPQYRAYLRAGAQRTLDDAHTFWRSQFPRGTTPGFLPAPRTGASASRIKRLLDPRQRSAVQRAASARGVTSFMYLFTAFSQAVAQAFSLTDFGVVVPVVDRRFPGGERVVGNCTQLVLVPQRGPVGLEQNAALLPQCYQHAAAPLGWLLEALRADGLPHDAPQVLFNLEPALTLPKLGEATLHEVDFPRPEARFPLSVHVFESDAGLRVDLDFLDEVVAAAHIEALADDFVTRALTEFA